MFPGYPLLKSPKKDSDDIVHFVPLLSFDKVYVIAG